MPKSTMRGLSERSRLFNWPRTLNASTHNGVSLPRSQKPATPYYSEQVPSDALPYTNFLFQFLSRYSHEKAVIFKPGLSAKLFVHVTPYTFQLHVSPISFSLQSPDKE